MKDVKENLSKLNVTHSSSNVTPATDDRKKSLRSNKKKNTQDIIDEDIKISLMKLKKSVRLQMMIVCVPLIIMKYLWKVAQNC